VNLIIIAFSKKMPYFANRVFPFNERKQVKTQKDETSSFILLKTRFALRYKKVIRYETNY